MQDRQSSRSTGNHNDRLGVHRTGRPTGRSSTRSTGRLVERLEPRQFLSGAQIDYTNFASTTGLVTNGFGSAPVTSNNALELTDGGPSEARSVFYGTRVPVVTFTSHFTYQVAEGQPGYDGEQEADGFTFVLDNGSTSDLGSLGNQLGYEGGSFSGQSVAIEFNLYNLGAFGSTVGFTSGGATPASTQSTSPVDFHTGDIIDATVSYSGGTLALTLKDSTTQQTFSTSEAINLPQLLGSQTAFVGFTGATGNDDSVQTINSFDFTGTGSAPTITSAAASAPAAFTGTKSHLSITAVSNDGGTLSYAWSTLHVPSGAAAPTFTPNSTTASANSIFHVSKAGTYEVRCTVTDSNGQSTVSDLLVVVEQTPTQIKLTPHKAQIVKGHTEQFSATVEDQFGHPLESQPGITYAISTGGGTINASTGLYSAGETAGHLVISAEADDLSGTAGATVIT